MDYQKLKSLIDDKSVAIVVHEDYVRVNHEIGNDCFKVVIHPRRDMTPQFVDKKWSEE